MIEVLLLSVWSAILVFGSFFLFRGTPLEFRVSTGQLWSIWFYKQFALIIPAVILATYYGVAAFPAAFFVVIDSQTFAFGLFSLYAITGFILVLAACLRILPRRFFDVAAERDRETKIKLSRFAVSSVIAGLLMMWCGILFFDLKHAFFQSIVHGDNIIFARLENKYSSHLPSQLQYVMTVSSWVSAIHAGILAGDRNKLKAVCFFLVGLILASVDGAKAPVVSHFMLAATAYLTVSKPKFNLAMALKTCFLGGPVLYALIYYVASLQFPNISIQDFNVYLANRLGVGQMAGAYESLALGGLRGDFYWHMIPFANLLMDYPVYDKELMLIVEGTFFDQTGVKNSLFISEAYGIGGWALAWLSPVIVGFSFATGLAFVCFFLRKFFGRAVASVYYLPIYVLSSNITGGFSPFPLYKGVILLLMVLSVFWILAGGPLRALRVIPAASSPKREMKELSA